MKMLLWLFYIGFTFYAFLPGLISRLFGFRSFNKARTKREIALTFDDGPDEKYTPMLLDLLKEHDLKATFFIVGTHAEKMPEIVQRMNEEGHLIGVHNYVHKTNWLMRPRSVKDQVQKTATIIEKITGQRPKFYRPPWGIVNLFDFSVLGQFQIILWSVMFGDWRLKLGKEKLLNKMLKKLKGGEIFLLHDCGRTFGADEDAPFNTIQALEQFLPIAKSKGYSFIRMDHMIDLHYQWKQKKSAISWKKNAFVSLWMIWEKIFHFMFQVKPVNEEHKFLYLRTKKYSGKEINLKDGTHITNGDIIAEIHLDNQILFDLGIRSKSAVHLAIQLIREMQNTMPAIASFLLDNEKHDNVKALYGISMINRGVEQFGFEVLDPPKNLFFTQMYLKVLLTIVHPHGKHRLEERSKMLKPKIVVMSVHELSRRYYENTKTVKMEVPQAKSMMELNTSNK